MNSRRDCERVADARALERPQLAAEPRLAGQHVAVGGARAADGADRRVVLGAQPGERLARVGADVDAVQADEVLERLEQVRVDRERAPVRLGGGQLDERADRVRVPVDLELEARLAVALDEHQRRRRRVQADLQLGGAAQRALVQPRARELEQQLGDLLRERQPAAVPALLGDRGELLRQVAGDAVAARTSPWRPGGRR